MLNVIFDATIIANKYKKDASRSGIFFVAWNLLLTLSKKKDVKLNLYFSPDKFAEGYKIKRDLFPNMGYAQNMDAFKWLCEINLFFWKVHGKLYSHFLLRKPFALGILLTQKLLLHLNKKNIKNEIFSSGAVFLSPVYRVPDIVRRFTRVKSFVVLHDAIPFKFPSYKMIGWSDFLSDIMRTSQEGDSFFCVSRCTQKDFMEKYLLVTKENSFVTLLAANENFKNVENEALVIDVKKKYGIPLAKKYVFSLCTLEPRKNLIRALKTFVTFCKEKNVHDLIWVLGGGHWESFIHVLNKEIENLDDFSDLIIRAGYVNDEDLPILYGNAEWFVYTSQYEGFGLPPLEAMQCGCPVIVSNNSSLPEVVGDAGILIDWDSDEQHVAAYEKYYFDKKFRDMKAAEGLERAKLFSWEKTVDQMVEVMKGC